MRKIIILFLLVGCTYIPQISTTSLVPINQSCVDVADGVQSYSISVRARYDVLGYADSIIKVTCPQALSFIEMKIKGVQPPLPVKEKSPILETEACCLPF